jgi:hypothetical protein
VAPPETGWRSPGGPVFAALALGGLAFWFVIGFPFAHHNESYEWVRWVGADLGSVVGQHFHGAVGYRPVAMLLAWVLYRVDGGSLVAVQLFNFACTALAWWTLLRAASSRRAFALAALVVGGGLFSGYIYLFHLHGVFYGPLLLWLAWVVATSAEELTAGRLLRFALSVVLVAMIHPFAVAFGVAFLGAALLERGWLRDPRRLALAAGAVAVGLALLLAVTPGNPLAGREVKLAALVASMRALEANRIVTMACLVLAVATAAGTERIGRTGRLGAAALVVTLAPVLGRLELPLTLVWLAAAIARTIIERRWTLAALLVTAVALPYAGGTGSPTYAVFAVALATFALAGHWDDAERVLVALRPAPVAGAAVALLALALVVRSGVRVPVVSALARPVIAERERSHQLDRMLRELLDSPWRSHPVYLAVESRAPVASGGGLDRERRPPTQQVCLDAFLEHARGAADSSATPIELHFADRPREPGARAILSLDGEAAGDAFAVVREDAAPAADTSSSRPGSPARP